MLIEMPDQVKRLNNQKAIIAEWINGLNVVCFMLVLKWHLLCLLKSLSSFAFLAIEMK